MDLPFHFSVKNGKARLKIIKYGGTFKSKTDFCAFRPPTNKQTSIILAFCKYTQKSTEVLRPRNHIMTQ